MRLSYRIKDALLLLIFFLLTLGPTSAKASFITLETQTSPTYDGKRFKMGVDVTNKGDEPAYNVQVNADINGRLVTTPAKDILQINKKDSVELAANMTLEKEGKYPVIVNVDYTDANQYPFTAISITQFVYGKSLPSEIFGTLQNIEISTKGNLNLSLKNLSDQEKKLTVRLIIPRELSSPSLSKTISLKAKSEEKVDFEVKNFSALPGSSYTIFALMEYDEGNLHYSASAGGNIKIKKEEGFVKSNQRLLIAVAIVLVVLFVYFNLRAFWTRRSKVG
jgi:CARDB